MPNVYIYVVDRDFGFAPNPFHNLCTLATCKQITRRVAKISDWIIGVGGSRLNSTGRCLFAMEVTEKITFEQYWLDPTYRDKKPIRNGSRKMIVGDNIYSKVDGNWHQANSHHSNPDGSPNIHNIKNDTRTNAVLVSRNFFYFGSEAIELPTNILQDLKYKNGRNHRKYSLASAHALISFLRENFDSNHVYGDPFDFDFASARYSAKTNKVTTEK